MRDSLPNAVSILAVDELMGSLVARASSTGGVTIGYAAGCRFGGGRKIHPGMLARAVETAVPYSGTQGRWGQYMSSSTKRFHKYF
jgi:hypothetical protein